MEVVKPIVAYDATMREAKQAVGVNLSVPAMEAMIIELDQLGGVTEVECGWPGASRMWDLLFTDIAEGRIPIPKNIKFAAFGSTRRARETVHSDVLFQKLVYAPVPIATAFAKCWEPHVVDALGTTLENNLAMVEESMAAICEAGKIAKLDGEHFFQGYLNDEAYALKVLEVALRGGAETLIMCDTNGIAMPWEVESIVARVVEEFGQDATIGVHMHGDRDHENTNTMVAIRAGARHFQGTVNGYSERVRMADTLIVLGNLFLLAEEGRADWAQVHDSYDSTRSRRVSRTLDRLSGLHPDPRRPMTGRFSSSHKGGAHVSAIVRGTPRLYESHDPAVFGAKRHIVLSSMAGGANVIAFTSLNWGVDVNGRSELIESIHYQIEDQEARGYSLDSSSGSAQRLVARLLWPEAPHYTPLPEEEKPYVFVDLSELKAGEVAAIVKLHDGSWSSPGTGDGPVDAIFQALHQTLAPGHSCLNGLKLEDYHPFQLSLEGLESTGAAMRVEIEWEHPKYGSLVTQGVSTNLIHASWEAICEAIELVLIKQWRQEQSSNEESTD